MTRGRDIVARHDRVLARHVTVTDPAHDAARRARAAQPRLPGNGSGDPDVAVRDLADYDRAFKVAS